MYAYVYVYRKLNVKLITGEKHCVTEKALLVKKREVCIGVPYIYISITTLL